MKNDYNVILIMEDSFRKDHLGCYGNQWIKTPFLDKFASESTIFNFAYAEGMPTIPVRISMFTGRYTLPFRGWQPLEQLDLPIAEILWDKEIRSALIADTYHMHKPQFGFGRGFDYVEWVRGQENDPWIVDPDIKVTLEGLSEKNWHPSYPGQPTSIVKRQFEGYMRNRKNWESEEDHHIAKVVKASMGWLERQVQEGNSKRLFLVLDSFDPHEPWDPPEEYLNMYPVPDYEGLPITWGGGDVSDWTIEEIRHIRAQYAGTITLCDKWTGIFLEKIDKLGLLDNTMIIFVSDHGEPLGEHGIVKKVKPWPYDELSHIPLMVRLPDKMDEGTKRVDDFAGFPDLAPTIINLFGVRTPTIMQGRNLLPIIQGESEGDKTGISGFNARSWSIRDHNYSFFLWLGPGEKTSNELYKYDPLLIPPEPKSYELNKQQSEIKDIAADQKDLSDLLEKKLRELMDNLMPSPGDLMSKDFMKRQIMYRPKPKS